MNLQTQSDFAISKFESRISTHHNFQEDPLKFTHWDDIINKILDVWFNKYESHLKLCNSEKDFTDLIIKFKLEINKIFSKKQDYLSYKTYYQYIIDYQTNLIKTEMGQFDFDQKEKNEIMFDKLRLLKIKPEIKILKNDQTTKNEILNPLMFNLSHLLRCHSKQNDPNDSNSQVSDAAFEIVALPQTMDQMPTYSNIFATCGQNTINLIDATNGKVLQRFNDDLLLNQTKEVYSRLCWTILNQVSVLAAVGKHGQIKLIIPKHSACLSRIDAHTSEISAILFHPKYPNILLSASDDHKIKIWKLNFKESASSTECELSFEKLSVIEYNSLENANKKERVLSLCFVSHKDLIISTDFTNYSVCLSEEKLFDQLADIMDQDMSNSMSNEDAVNYLTSKPQDKNNRVFTAEKLKIFSYSSNNNSFEDSFITNKLLYLNNLLVAFIADSEMIYILKVEANQNVLLGHVVSHIKLGDYKNEINSNPGVFKNHEMNKFTLLRPTTNGLFEYILLNTEVTNLDTALRYVIPAEYTIKNQKDLTKIPVKDYNLLERAKVLVTVSNGEYIVASTNQNLISIWNKSL